MILAAFEVGAEPSEKPVEIMSDPYGVGNPTVYSIIRGATKVTFSHPMAGQFTRAEIIQRGKVGFETTRFNLSSDGTRYIPTLLETRGYLKRNSKHEEKICLGPTEASPLRGISALKDKSIESAIIAKRRAELTKEDFFDRSCFDPSIAPEHRNAIMNAAADVLTPATQNSVPEPTYLRCLEKYGSAHIAGEILALKKASSAKQAACKMRLACTSDDDAEAGEFDEKKCLITIKTSPEPERSDYGREIFHEMTHAVPVGDGTKLRLLEECCTAGKKCDTLRALAEQEKVGTKMATLSERLDLKATVSTSTITVLKGSDKEAAELAPTHKSVQAFERVSLSAPPITDACKAQGAKACDLATLASIAQVNAFMQSPINACLLPPGQSSSTSANFDITDFLFAKAHASNNSSIEDCEQSTGRTKLPDEFGAGFLKEAIQKAEKASGVAKFADVVDSIPQNSPLTWDIPKETSVPIRMVDNETDDASIAISNASAPKRVPTRTIASISPLPDEKLARRMGSRESRADVASGRATKIVDTMLKAAQTVSTTLTPVKIDSLAVNRDDIFKKGFKPKTEKPHYVVASFASQGIKVADIGDIKGLGFANPFAGAKEKSATDSRAAAVTAMDEKPTRKSSIIAKNATPLASDATGAGTPGEASASSTTVATTTRTTTLTTSSSREPSTSGARATDFSAMERKEFIGFLTSSYRTVSTELDSPSFNAALSTHNIVIYDHENNKRGSSQPNPTTFIYNANLSRLVQTRTERSEKTERNKK